MEDCKPVLTPMVTGFKLNIDDSSKDVDQMLYRSMIGSLLYVTASRLDVMQAVGESAPKESHIIVIERIIRYLNGTTKCGLWYPKGNKLIIHSFTDAYWVGSVDDHESTHEALEYIHQKLGILPSSH